MEISQHGIDFMKDQEVFSAIPYKDVGKKPTIGYGHLIKFGESFTKLTKEEATLLFEKDLEWAEFCVNNQVKVPLTQNQYDALVSLVFNIGVGKFFASTLLHFLNKKDYKGASEQFLRWIYVKGKKCHGLENRRAAEKEIFDS